MTVKRNRTLFAMGIVFLSLLVQLGFATNLFGPAWLSPVLTLPAIAAIASLWRRAESENASTRAFTELVI
jgi:hypothetical protein